MSVSVLPSPPLENKRPRLRADQVARPCRLPNGAERVEIYGLDGKLHRIQEPDGSSLEFRYTMDGPLRLVEHSSGERVEYEHRAEQKCLRAANTRSETTVEFDDHGFPVRMVQRVDGFEWTIGYERDHVGRVSACRYPQVIDWLRTTARETGNEVRSNFSAGAQSYFDVAMHDGLLTIAFADGTSSSQAAGEIHYRDGQGSLIASSAFSAADNRRLERSGDHTFHYDEAGRLASFVHLSGASEYRYDEQGRLTEVRSEQRKTALHYVDQVTPTAIDGEAIAYDALGRRTACGNTRYHYNLYGQLTEVTLADGPPVRYLYDGFGRLVGRECGGECVYYIVDFDGHRIAEADARGRVQRSYLWLGAACVAAVDGVIGAALARSFHRGVSSNIAAIGFPGGALQLVDWRDPYGADQLDHAQIPAIASLFPDPATRLYHAGTRWFDPRTAQFLTPDGWFGTDCWNHMPPAMRTVFDSLPEGTNVVQTPQAAYVWCHYDPVNFADPNGHSVGEGFGIFFSIISFFLWQMHVTSYALQMAALNFVIMILPSLIDLIVSAAKDKPLWGVNIFNAIPPLVASSRLMVPWAFPLNSLYNPPGTAFTMGSVIWMRGSENRTLAQSSKRDILLCTNAATYAAFKDSVAVDVFAVPRPAIKGTGTMNAAADTITSIVLDAGLGAGAVLTDFFSLGDPISVRIGPAGLAEFSDIGNFVGADILLTQALPAAFNGAAVEFFRLDQPMVKIEKDGKTVARSITFVRGNSIHFQKQLPEDFPDAGLKATEYLFADKRQLTNFSTNREFVLIELPAGAIDSYAAGDFLRILSGSSYFGRKVERKQGSNNLILDLELDRAVVGPAPKVEVAVMAAKTEAPVNNQTAVADKVTVGALRTLRKRDGLSITFAGPPIVVERRIVLETFLRCALDSILPAPLQTKPVKLDLLLPDAIKANGKLTAVDTVTTGKDGAKQFQKDQPVRVSAAPNKEFNTTIKLVTAAAETIQFTENPPAADFPANIAVTVVLLKAFKTIDGESGPAPDAGADQTIDVPSDDLSAPAADALMLVRSASGNDPPVLRKVKGDPLVVAKVDSAPANLSQLTIQTFSADAAKTKQGAAKEVVLRLTASGASPFHANDEIYCTDTVEEYLGKVNALNAVAPADLILEDPIFTKDFGAGAAIQVSSVESSGAVTPDASLDESLLLIPADPDEDPVTRARSIPLHEMRHVWQYAVLGPFFFSQPIPWLIDLGFQFKSDGAAHAANKITKWTSLGILDKLFSVIALGFSDGGPSTTVDGTVATIKRIDIDPSVTADAINHFENGDPVEVGIGDNKIFNIVDTVSVAGHTFDLRFELKPDEFPVGAAVKVTISPFERMNSKVSKLFSLNIAQIWGDHLPTSWGRTLLSFLNRESWFPLLGLYPIALLRSGFKQQKIYFEQDASFQSGALFPDGKGGGGFGVSYPNEVFVGEYSRVIAYVPPDRAKGLASGISHRGRGITRTLTVKTPSPSVGKTAVDLVPGSVSVGADEVRFRKEVMLPMHEKIENAMGAMFAANTPGEYTVLSQGQSLEDMVDPALWLPPFIPFFPASFNDLRKINVKALGVDKQFTHDSPLFETEAHTFVVTGAKNLTYALAYKVPHPPPQPAVQGVITNDRTFTAPALAAAVEEKHTLQIICTYQPDDDIFKARGKAHGKVTLPPANLTNVCQDLEIVIAPITVTEVVPGPVSALGTKEFRASIAPRVIGTPTNVPEAFVQARLTSDGGRPAKLTFFAPSRVNATTDVVIPLTFGAAPGKQIDLRVTVEPIFNPADPGPRAFDSFVYASPGLVYPAALPEFAPFNAPSPNFETRTIDISDFADLETLNAWPFDNTKFPLNGFLRVPQGPGPFPLALFAHGNHAANVNSARGYIYLCELLSSHGVIAGTIDVSCLNATRIGENDARAIVHLEHIRQFVLWNGRAGHPLHGRVDTSRIMIVGHSRGGEAVGHASLFNRLDQVKTDLVAPTVRLDGSAGLGPYHFSLKAVVAIAPTDGQYEPVTGPTKVPDNYIIIHGSRDGDVKNFPGYLTYDRSHAVDLGNPTAAPGGYKALVWIYRANHGFFNSVWDQESPKTPLLRPEQEQIARAYFGAIAQAELLGRAQFREILKDHRVAFNNSWLPAGSQIISQYQDPHRLFIQHFKEAGATLAVSAPVQGTVTATAPLTAAKISFNQGATARLFQDSNGAQLSWSAAGAYTIQLVAGKLSTAGFDFLALRIGQSTEAANPAGANQDMTMSVGDGVQTLEFPLSQYGLLPYPDTEAVDTDPKTIMQMIRIPFQDLRSRLNLNNVIQIQLRSNLTAAGIVYLNDVQITS